MSPISDIVKFAILQVAIISSIFLLIDIAALCTAILFHGVEISRTLTVLATTRGTEEMSSVAVFYALLSGAFQNKFGRLHVLAKETTSLILLFAVCALYHTFYRDPGFKFVLTDNQTADFAILYTGLYLFIRVVLVVGEMICRKQNPDSD